MRRAHYRRFEGFDNEPNTQSLYIYSQRDFHFADCRYTENLTESYGLQAVSPKNVVKCCTRQGAASPEMLAKVGFSAGCMRKPQRFRAQRSLGPRPILPESLLHTYRNLPTRSQSELADKDTKDIYRMGLFDSVERPLKKPTELQCWINQPLAVIVDS